MVLHVHDPDEKRQNVLGARQSVCCHGDCAPESYSEAHSEPQTDPKANAASDSEAGANPCAAPHAPSDSGANSHADVDPGAPSSVAVGHRGRQSFSDDRSHEWAECDRRHRCGPASRRWWAGRARWRVGRI